ncbi:MAG: DUF423 domain-containing protein [Nitrospinae bacterium]|jgi:uncharacterized membrane protein YgdD (TMEM256/DUF423 family)|nr:DUF423 domain-containing protein [Nitrospinota bacterium]MDA1109978.1 DUF423 domain-containing protein [Nitrospinota bacterium]
MNWISLGAGLGGLSVLLGAFGAHSLKDRLTEQKLATFHTATDYLAYHALALILVGILVLVLGEAGEKALKKVGIFFTTGIVLFSGSLYALAFDGPRFFGPVTPFGGLFFMTGWFTLAVVVAKLLNAKN